LKRIHRQPASQPPGPPLDTRLDHHLPEAVLRRFFALFWLRMLLELLR